MGISPTSVIRKSVQKTRESLRRFEPIYQIDLRRRGASLSPATPPDRPINTTLKTTEEYEEASLVLRDLGLHQHPDPPKNWDHLTALASLLDDTEQSNAILDAGGARYSPLAEWLYLYGYRDLHVLNLGFEGRSKRGPIQYRQGDITNSDYDTGRFDAITSLSVIEHNIDVRSFLKECNRLLKSGGYLILSTDFWKEPLDNESVEAYGMPWRPFTPDRINRLIKTAESLGFSLTSEYDLTTEDRTVEWQGESYTFIILKFRLQK